MTSVVSQSINNHEYKTAPSVINRSVDVCYVRRIVAVETGSHKPNNESPVYTGYTKLQCELYGDN